MWESKELARKLLDERAEKQRIALSKDLRERKAIALSYCIRNARENLLTNNVSLTTETTSFYYGCLWLASAVAVADPSTDHLIPINL